MKAKTGLLAYLSVLLLATSITVTHAENSWDDAIIFINPGHNGWTIANDRNLATINHEAAEEEDTCGFFETNTNLHKAFAIRDDLVAAGKTFRKDVYMSRTINGITAGKAYIDDDGQLQLAPTRVIAGYADYYEADYFISIHSNATSSDGTTTNYLLFLYNGTDSESDDVDGNSKSMATKAWDYAIDNPLTWKSSTSYIRGDVSWYGEKTDSYNQYNLILNSSGSSVTYKGSYSYGLIVLCHDRAGYLVEGTFHSYHPERQRLLNRDYCRQEGLRYARAIRNWYGVTANTTGEVYGTVKDISTSLENDLYVYKSGTTDIYYPLNNVRVYLHDSTGAYVGSYMTDDEYNGVFAFTGLAPGTYYLNFKDITATTTASTSYVDLVVKIDVTADNTSFTNVCLSPSSSTSGTCDEDGDLYTGSITFTYEDGASEPNPSDDEEGSSGTTSTTTTASRRIFAYDLEAQANTSTTDGETTIDSYTISFKTNIEASEFTLNFYTYDAETDTYDTTPTKSITYSDPSSYLSNSTYSVDITADEIGTAATFRWSVTASAGAVTSFAGVTEEGVYGLQFYSPWGVAVDDSPESPYFGTVYVTNTNYSSSASSSSYESKKQGLYRFDPTDESLDSDSGYDLGLTWTSSSGVGPRRVAVTDDGRIFVCDYGTSNSGIYYVDPSTMTATKFHSNSSSEITQITALGVYGSGSDTKLYAVVYSSSGSTIYRYDIGESNTWSSSSPSASYTISYITAAQSNIAPVDGGFWIAQYKSATSSSAPFLIYYDEGTNSTTFTSYSIDSSSYNSNNGAVATFDQEGLLAHVYNSSTSTGGVRLFYYTVDSDGTITYDIEGTHSTYTLQGRSSNAYAFDYAGNLYSVSSNKEAMAVYAIPTSDNSRTTMATYSGTAGDGYILDFSEADSGSDDNNETDSNYSSLYDNAERRIFAYDLYASLYGEATGDNNTSDTYAISFKTNIPAEEFSINLYKYSKSRKTYSSTATKTLRYTSASQYLTDDTYTVYLTSDADQLGNGTIWRWSVTAVAGPVADFQAVSNDSNSSLQYYSPFGIAVDDSPESPYFGTVYVANTNYSSSYTNYKSKKQGLYRISPTDESLDDDTCYDLGISWTTTSGEGPRRVAVADDGRIFVCDYGTTNTGIYYVDPETMSATAWFSGATNSSGSIDYGDIHLGGMTAGLGVRGGDSDTQVYAIDYSNSSGLYRYIYRYDIGSDNVWATEAPVEYAPLTTWVANSMSNIAPVDGGFWVCQYRSSGNSTSAYPMLFYFDETINNSSSEEDDISTASSSDSSTTGTGSLLFQSAGIDESGYNSQYGALAVYEPEGLVASSYNVTSNSTSYAGVRLISYTISDEVLEYSVDGIYDTSDEQGSRSNAFAFDYAGNLYAVSNNSEIVTVYSVPTDNNSATTMATETNSSTQSAYIGFSTSDLTSGTDTPDFNSPVVKIYPNPASDQVTVESSTEIDNVALYTVGNGALVMRLEGAGENSVQLDVSTLARGIYIVSVDGSSHKLIVK